eukprot:3752408-Rhodomonas_salina.1
MAEGGRRLSGIYNILPGLSSPSIISQSRAVHHYQIPNCVICTEYALPRTNPNDSEAATGLQFARVSAKTYSVFPNQKYPGRAISPLIATIG